MMTLDKPWGSEQLWAHTSTYVGKILRIKAGEALSLQYHRLSSLTVDEVGRCGCSSASGRSCGRIRYHTAAVIG